MDAERATLLLTAEELPLLVSHLKRHLTQVDQELVRTDNHELQHAIAHEVKVLEGVVARLEPMARAIT